MQMFLQSRAKGLKKLTMTFKIGKRHTALFFFKLREGKLFKKTKCGDLEGIEKV